jgi:hypothetical protein
MPSRPTRTRLQCPSCSKAFGSESQRPHFCSTVQPLGAGAPASPMPDACLTSACLSRVAGPACRRHGSEHEPCGCQTGRAGFRLDSAGQGGPGGQLPPLPIPPPATADSDSDVPWPPADPSAPAGGPAALPAMPQGHRMICFNTNTYKYIYIHAGYVQNTYRYGQIHTDAGIYDKI